MDEVENKKMEYPVDMKSKDFVQKMAMAATYQKQNKQQVQKSAFYGEDCSGKKVFNIELSDQLFKDCKFYTSNIIRCVFKNCTFIDCNFSAASMFNVQFVNCTFRKCDFTDAELQDVNAIDCIKVDCILTNINFINNVNGFSEQDQNVVGDSIENTGITQNKSVYQNVKIALSDWNQIEQMSFEYVGQDQNCGLAIYPNPQKNQGGQNQDYWEFVFFYGNQSVLMNDFNLFGMTSEQIKALVDRWKKQDLVQQSKTIINNIISVIQELKK